MAKIEPANLLLKDKNGNTGLVKSLTNKDITTLKNVVTNVNYIKDFVNANGGSLPVQGDLKLTATDAAGKNGKTLLGTSSGTLQWNGKNIVRSVNGTNADANGNVSITSVANATKATQDKNGAQIDTTYFKSANGTFTGTEFTRNVDNSALKFYGGTSWGRSASISLTGNKADNPCTVDVFCHNPTSEVIGDFHNLHLQYGKGPTWNDNPIEIVNSVGPNYIRYESGIQIEFNQVVLTTKKQKVNFLMPFKSYPLMSFTLNGNLENDSAVNFIGYTTPTPTYFTAFNNWDGSNMLCMYIAIGKWK